MFFGKIKVKIGENYNISTKLYNFSVEACQARLPEAELGPTGRVPRLPGYGAVRRSQPIGNTNVVSLGQALDPCAAVGE